MRARRAASSRSSPGRDPRRRNRNDGTARRGHGQDNRQVIPQPHLYGDRSFFHVLKDPVRCSRTIRERTLLHEIGHHVDWCRATPEFYFRRPLQERERSAHRYAMTLRTKLEQRRAIPFDRIRDEAAMRADALGPRWFGSALTKAGCLRRRW